MPAPEIDYNDYLTADVLAELEVDFKQHDLDERGTLLEEELVALLAAKGLKIPDKQVKEMWKEVVADPGMGMHFEDLCCLWVYATKAKPRADLIDYREYLDNRTVQELQASFDSRDPAVTGFITAAEAVSIVRESGDHEGTDRIIEVLNQVCPQPQLYSRRSSKMEDESSPPVLRKQSSNLSRASSRASRASKTGRGSLIKTPELLEQHMPTHVEKRRRSSHGACFRARFPEPRNIDFAKFCAFWAVVKHKRRRIKYREFLSNRVVKHLRELFDTKAGANHCANANALMQVLKNLGGMFNETHMKQLIKEFDVDLSGDIDFEEFCIMMVKMRRERRRRKLDPTTCSCTQLLLEEHFTIPELQGLGFHLEHFREVGLPVGRLRAEGHYSALEFRRAGYEATELRRGGVGPGELRRCGFSLPDLRRAGFSDPTLTEVNRTLHASMSVGDASILPQRRAPKAAAPADGSCTEGEHRPLTSWIRSHTDWRNKGPSLFAVTGAGVVAT
mmetsp:Transcript_16839/g.37777  ORF Transcript_16839/g.37777 Transcript_16839/m.37777 type:complete len:503 (+) Transcript_16839:2370-3878(+)